MIQSSPLDKVGDLCAIGESSNGRTHPSGGWYLGSNPGSPAKEDPRKGIFLFPILPDIAQYNKITSILERIPAGRSGTPDDLKGVVVFLASSAYDYLNGAIIPVDGGWLAR